MVDNSSACEAVMENMEMDHGNSTKDDNITTTKQTTTKLFANIMKYTVRESHFLSVFGLLQYKKNIYIRAYIYWVMQNALCRAGYMY